MTESDLTFDQVLIGGALILLLVSLVAIWMGWGGQKPGTLAMTVDDLDEPTGQGKARQRMPRPRPPTVMATDEHRRALDVLSGSAERTDTGNSTSGRGESRAAPSPTNLGPGVPAHAEHLVVSPHNPEGTPGPNLRSVK